LDGRHGPHPCAICRGLQRHGQHRAVSTDALIASITASATGCAARKADRALPLIAGAMKTSAPLAND
jgi:hypothetical protein